jgi:hypothetical protein
MMSYPCDTHKLVDHKIIRSINYLTYGWEDRKDHRFLGFIPTYKIEDGCVKSLVIGGNNFIACHVFFCDTSYLCGDVSWTEKPYILMFKGCDDLSYALRFGSLYEALMYFEKLDIFSRDLHKECLMYN